MRWLSILFLLSGWSIFAQQFSTKINPEKFEVGEVFTVLFEIEGTENLHLAKDMPSYFLRPNAKKEEPDTIRFEFVEEFGDSVLPIQGKTYYQVFAKALCFDTGLFLYAPKALIRGVDTIRFDAAICRVDYTPQTDQSEIKDIEEIFAELPAEPWSFSEFFRKYGIWMLLFLILVATFWLWRRKRGGQKEHLQLASLKEKTIQQFDELCANRLWEKENLESHFIPVVDLLRSYLGKEYGFQLQHKTSFEILFLLGNNGLSDKNKDELTLFLEVGDLIKFAQSQMAAGGVELINLRIRKFLIDFEK